MIRILAYCGPRKGLLLSGNHHVVFYGLSFCMFVIKINKPNNESDV